MPIFFGYSIEASYYGEGGNYSILLGNSFTLLGIFLYFDTHMKIKFFYYVYISFGNSFILLGIYFILMFM